MSTVAFSPSSFGFFEIAWRQFYEAAGTWPNDAVAIPVEMAAEYEGEPPAGKRRGATENGMPCWVDIPPASLDDLATAALRRINAGYSAAIAQILVDYPDAETLSFDKQEAQARAWQAWADAGAVPDDEPATPYLDSMLLERPIGKAELVSRILTKADQFTAAHGQATGRRQRLEDEAKAALEAEDRAALEAIGWGD
ncbi:MAG: tail fiber assembly protein [Pseudomonadota bacterium]|nr:tail fiber assembly protein [Pseudomonadota bacterium]